MANTYFQFKKFIIHHDRCAMKVGTDGVLLGAWANAENARRILDIGVGSGLISLMLAQRYSSANIVGIDIDEDAIVQAKENAELSPWKDRIELFVADVCEFSKNENMQFGAIVSNPPYFEEKVHCPDGQRNAARHTQGLSFADLLDSAKRLLAPEGGFSVVLPSNAYDTFVSLAAERHLYVRRCTKVFTKPGIPAKRVLVELGHGIVRAKLHDLYIEVAPRIHSDEYVALTKDFYLKM